jgi:hypothetical protein
MYRNGIFSTLIHALAGITSPIGVSANPCYRITTFHQLTIAIVPCLYSLSVLPTLLSLLLIYLRLPVTDRFIQNASLIRNESAYAPYVLDQASATWSDSLESILDVGQGRRLC